MYGAANAFISKNGCTVLFVCVLSSQKLVTLLMCEHRTGLYKKNRGQLRPKVTLCKDNIVQGLRRTCELSDHRFKVSGKMWCTRYIPELFTSNTEVVKEHRATLQSLGGHTVKLLKLVKLPLHGLHLWGFTKNAFFGSRNLLNCCATDISLTSNT